MWKSWRCKKRVFGEVPEDEVKKDFEERAILIWKEQLEKLEA
jgi:hypothetical protein